MAYQLLWLNVMFNFFFLVAWNCINMCILILFWTKWCSVRAAGSVEALLRTTCDGSRDPTQILLSDRSASHAPFSWITFWNWLSVVVAAGGLRRSPPVRLLACDRSWSRLSVPELLGLPRLSDSPLGCFGSGRKANRLSASLSRLSPPDADDAGEELGGSGEEAGPSPGQQRQRLPRGSGEQRQEELVR